ncbi:hypothetical protein M5689_000535 [Euphorbia peplus]|nr:hypothetical protein M5689_000535 [Euphorbia peplus]
MNLPTFNARFHDSPTQFTFSSNPTLPGCVFFAIHAPDYQRIEIRTCRIGDNGWKGYQINFSIPYVRFYVECINGLLYVVLLRADNVEGDPLLNSHVATFDPQSKELKLIKSGKWIMKSNGKKVKSAIKEWSVNLVLYNSKELYLVRWIPRDGVWDFFKFDMDENQWVEQPGLGNRVLFCCISSFLVDAVGTLTNLANIVFFGYGGSTCHPYSFSSREIEYDREHYAEDRRNEDGKLYQRVWIMPTI